MDVVGKRIWITGASSGIGEALAKLLAGKGAKLILSARNTEKLNRLKNELGVNATCEVVSLDLGDQKSLSAAFSKVIATLGGVDILINNGGISQRSEFLKTEPEVIDQIMKINFFGAVHLTRLVLPGMIKQGQGKIVAISSVVGKFGFPLRTGYSSSKHALHGFFDSLRFEVEKQNVSVMLVCPGRVHTNISLNALEGDGSKHGEMDPGQKGGVSASSCARSIVRGIEKDKLEIYPGGKEVLMVYFRRFLPFLFRRIVRNIEAK